MSYDEFDEEEMNLNETSEVPLERKLEELRAVYRAQRSLERRLSDIAWKYEVLKPAEDDFKKKVAAGWTPRIEIEREGTD